VWLLSALIFSGWGFDPEDLLDLTHLAITAIVSCTIAAAQALLVLPVHAPAHASRGPWARALHRALAAGALGVTAGALAVVVQWAFAYVRSDGPHWWPAWYHALPAAVVVGVVAHEVLRRRCPDGLPVRLALVIAALCAALLVAGLTLTALGVVRLLVDEVLERAVGVTFLVALAPAWLAGTVLLWRFSRGRSAEGVLSRVAAWLFVGTLVEVVASIPVDVMIRRKTPCYSAEPTYWSLSIGGAVGLIALGPMIWLGPVARRRKRWLTGRCEVCGYDMSATPRAERCPECGTGWKPRRTEPEVVVVPTRAAGATPDPTSREHRPRA
jgi:hypothetical protein